MSSSVQHRLCSRGAFILFFCPAALPSSISRAAGVSSRLTSRRRQHQTRQRPQPRSLRPFALELASFRQPEKRVLETKACLRHKRRRGSPHLVTWLRGGAKPHKTKAASHEAATVCLRVGQFPTTQKRVPETQEALLGLKIGLFGDIERMKRDKGRRMGMA